MNTTILMAYASKYGSTREVADAVAAALAQHGLRVDVRAANDVETLERFGGVVLGTGLYMGRAHRDARRFLHRHHAELAALPLAVFGMGPDSMADDKVAGSRAQLDKALQHAPDVKPDAEAIFGGVVDPDKFHWPLNRIPASDARDWDAIEAWADEVAELMASRVATPA
jgi:menaquinone-dependent protoporphyrinogen oxidase